MKINKLLIVIIVFCASYGCINNEKLNTFGDLTFVQKIQNSQIGCITNIIGNDNGYYISDWKSNQIFHYNWEDSLQNVFGNSGSGPGEFGKLSDISFDIEGNIFTSDQNRPVLQMFDYIGNYRKSIKTAYPSIGISCTAERHLLVNSLSPEYAYYMYDYDGNLLETYEPNNLDENIMINVLRNVSRLYTYKGNTYIIKYNSPSIYKLSLTKLDMLFQENIFKNIKTISYEPDANEVKIDRGSIVFSDLNIDNNYAFLTGGGGDSDKNKIDHFLHIYQLPDWELILISWYPDLPYSPDGYTLCKYNDYLYLAPINEGDIYKFKIERYE